MPLIVMCGFPCSGKTRRAEELKAHFEENTDRQVHTVGDGALGVDRNCVYAASGFYDVKFLTLESQKEKDARASLKAEVERKVSKDNFVILDSLNYIKGYRYELFCLTKHARTPHCLVYCLTSSEESSLWNKNRDAAEQYGQDIFDALVQRFEAPDSRNRWDSPLFTVLKDDILPLEAISDALFKRKAPPPNQSTQSQPLSSTNFLYELDKITQDVLMAIFNAQRTSVPGDLISVPGATEKISFTFQTKADIQTSVFCGVIVPGNCFIIKDPINTPELKAEQHAKVELTRTINMAELRKLRRQFISYSKMHPTENTWQIANMFVQYLNKSLH